MPAKVPAPEMPQIENVTQAKSAPVFVPGLFGQAVGTDVGCLATANSLVHMMLQFNRIVQGVLSGKGLLDLPRQCR